MGSYPILYGIGLRHPINKKEKFMKAIIYTKYGSPEVLQVTELEKPVPNNNEVLIKIHAASVTAADTMMRKGSPYIGRLFLGMTKPKYPVIGTGFSGEIEAIGNEVTHFKIGDSVFGESIFGAGTSAEYLCAPEDGVLAIKPDNITYDEACSVCDGALTSLSFLKDVANIKKNQRVLIIGASGSLGSAAVQIAKNFDANVTAVCSGTNAIWVKDLGADEVIDYTVEDFTRINNTYDIIYDTVGKYSYLHCKGMLNKTGTYLSPVFGIVNLFQMLCTSIFSTKKAKFSATGMRSVPELRELLSELKAFLEERKIKMIIDKRYPLIEVSAAHTYVDKGHKKGNVVLTISTPPYLF